MEIQNLPWYGQFLVFFLIALLFGGGLFWYLEYDSNETAIERYSSRIETLNRDILRAEQKQRQLPQLRKDMEQTKIKLEQIKTILPEKEDVEQILKRIQALISNARLKMLSFKPMNYVAKKIYFEKPIKIQIEGNYHNTAIFFDKLSKLKKIFTVNNLSIKPLNRGRSNDFTIMADFTAVLYLYRDTTPQKETAGGKKK